MEPPETADLTRLLSMAPVVFRATAVHVSHKGDKYRLPRLAVARLRVDRWYRGGHGKKAIVYYDAPRGIIGHDCIDLTPHGEQWLIFAVESNGRLEFVDDCEGAVRVSRLKARMLERSTVIAQMEADFEAGLGDADRAARLVSLQRLGGLKSPAALPALHKLMQGGDSSEKAWATYAAVRIGDPTALAAARDTLARGRTDVPLGALRWELGRFRDPSQIPNLVRTVETAPDAEERKRALEALEEMHPMEALPAVAARLADCDRMVRIHALMAMNAITCEPVCAFPAGPRFTNEDVDQRIRRCASWWNDTGRKELAAEAPSPPLR